MHGLSWADSVGLSSDDLTEPLTAAVGEMIRFCASSGRTLERWNTKSRVGRLGNGISCACFEALGRGPTVLFVPFPLCRIAWGSLMTRIQLFRSVSLLGLMCLLGVVAGCSRGSSGPPVFTVKGAVTFDGAPVETGRIEFRKVDGDGKAFAGEIKDGNYSLQCEAGKMTVKVTASRIIPVNSIRPILTMNHNPLAKCIFPRSTTRRQN